VWGSPREVRRGEKIAWYADGETVARSEQSNLAYAYGMCLIRYGGQGELLVELVLFQNGVAAFSRYINVEFTGFY
jgi:hypothetical protein